VPTEGARSRSRGSPSSAKTSGAHRAGGPSRATFQNVQLFGEDGRPLQNVLVGPCTTPTAATLLDVALHPAALPARGGARATARALRVAEVRGPGSPGRRGRHATCRTASSACWRSPAATGTQSGAAAARRGPRAGLNGARHQGTGRHHPQDPREHGITPDPHRAPTMGCSSCRCATIVTVLDFGPEDRRGNTGGGCRRIPRSSKGPTLAASSKAPGRPLTRRRENHASRSPTCTPANGKVRSPARHLAGGAQGARSSR